MPEHVVPMMAKLGKLPAKDDGWAYEIKWDGVRAIAYSEPGRLRLESRNLNDITAQYPEVRPLNRALSSHTRRARRRARRVRRRRAAELRAASAAHAPDRRVADPATRAGLPGRLRHLRPALPRRPLADGAALHRAARAARGARARRARVADALVQRRRRRRAARRERRTRARGHRGQAARLPVRARQARDHLDQGQDQAAPGARDRRLAAGRGPPQRATSARS